MVTDPSEETLQEMRQLFAELDGIYDRLRATLQRSVPGDDAADRARLAEERSKASDIIQRIRKIHGL
jgi:hypothetical protein